ncbi:MAG: CPBP family intramembrane metalloprotease [Chloroflexi bacterium]|nr:CPBP family intramembrane metalloprotease [Chloroflexota bacterium]
MIKKHSLLSFFLLTFAITWGIAGLSFLAPNAMIALTRKEADAYHPLFRLAASAPTLAAFLVILVTDGKSGILNFAGRYLEFTKLRWYLILFGGILGYGFILRFIEQSLGLPVPSLPFSWISFLPFALYWPLYDPGPFGEEGGWRGFALPRLQQHFSPYWSGVVLGVIWSVWHLPAFYISTLSQSGLIFPLFMLGNISLVLFMTSIYNATQGNIPLMIVIHWAYNLIGVLVPMDGYFFVANSILLLAAAFVINYWTTKSSPKGC